MIPSKDPATMPYHLIRRWSVSGRPPKLISVALGPAGSFHGSRGCVAFYWRMLHQCSLLTSRLYLTEDEGQRYLLIRT